MLNSIQFGNKISSSPSSRRELEEPLSQKVNRVFEENRGCFSSKACKNIRTTIEVLEDAEQLLEGKTLKYKHFSAHKRDQKRLTAFFAQVCFAANFAYEKDPLLFINALDVTGCHIKRGNAILDYYSQIA